MADRARVYEVGLENALSEDLARQEKQQSKRLERRRFWNFKRLSNITIAVCVFISVFREGGSPAGAGPGEATGGSGYSDPEGGGLQATTQDGIGSQQDTHQASLAEEASSITTVQEDDDPAYRAVVCADNEFCFAHKCLKRDNHVFSIGARMLWCYNEVNRRGVHSKWPPTALVNSDLYKY